MADMLDTPAPDQVPCLRKDLTTRLRDSLKSKMEVSPDVFLYMYKNKAGDEFFIVYELEVMRYCSGVHFVLDFAGSKNISLVPFTEQSPTDTPHIVSSSSDTDSGGDTLLQLQTTVAPFQRQKFGQVHLLNSAQRAILKYKHSWSLCEVVSKADMNKTAKELEKKIQLELRTAARFLPVPPPSNQFSCALSPSALKRVFTKQRGQQQRGTHNLTSFIDQAFPPTISSLQPSDASTAPAIETKFPVVWNRPK